MCLSLFNCALITLLLEYMLRCTGQHLFFTPPYSLLAATAHGSSGRGIAHQCWLFHVGSQLGLHVIIQLVLIELTRLPKIHGRFRLGLKTRTTVSCAYEIESNRKPHSTLNRIDESETAQRRVEDEL